MIKIIKDGQKDFVVKCPNCGYVWKLKDGRVVELRVTIKDDEPVDDKE